METALGESASRRFSRVCAVVSLVLTVAVGLAVSPDRSAAQTPPRVLLFLVDTSTSMYGKPLADAQNAIKGASSALPGASIGLRSFGGPCDNRGIERLAIGPFDQLSFNAAVDSLAIGEPGTPTPAALAEAGATLPDEGDRTIVLISDGGSSCGDPCPTAQALKDRLGAGFRIDAVGFRTPDRAEAQLTCIARVTGGTYVSVNDTTALQAALAEASAARVTSLSLSPRKFSAARKGDTVGNVTARKGAEVRYVVSESARVRFTVKQGRVGRKVRGKCRKRTAKNRLAPRCTRYVPLRGNIVLDALEGENRFGFTGRWNGKRLRPGRYELIARATDASGVVGKRKVARFRIVRKAPA